MGKKGTTKYSFIKKGYIQDEWTVISVSNKIVKAQCSCGYIKEQKVYDFVNKASIRCQNGFHRQNDKVGLKFGKLTLLKFIRKGNYDNNYYECICDCGNKTIKSIKAITKSKNASCGCHPRPKRNSDGIPAMRKWFQSYRTRARRENISFKINQAQFSYLTQQSCFYCGIKQFTTRKLHNDEYSGNGIDRIDNSKGYFIENLLTCCHICNRSKGSLSLKRIEQISKIIPKNIILSKINPDFKKIIGTVKYLMISNHKLSLSDTRLLKLLSTPCIYCNQLSTRIIHKKEYKMSGIDRLCSNKGYSETNSVPCCKECNVNKKDFSINSAKKLMLFLKTKKTDPMLHELKKIEDNFKCFSYLPFKVKI